MKTEKLGTTRNFGFTLGRTAEGERKDYEALEKRLAEQERAKTNPPAQPIVVPASSGDFWTIPGVNYRGNVVDVQLLKNYLDNGNAKTQDDWARYSEQARAKGEFYLPDYPLFFATLERAYALKTDATIEEMRKKVQKLSRAKWLMTTTRIKYANKGKDKIVHNYGMSDPQKLEEPFVGADGTIPSGSPETLYQKLLGTQSSVANINSVFKWLNGTDAYMYRVNSKPNKLDERVAAGFDADSDWAYFDCDRIPTNTNTGLGVRYARRVAPSIVGKNGGTR